MMRRLAVIAMVLGVGLSGCGGGSHHSSAPSARTTTVPGVQGAPKPTEPQGCQTGKSYMGCSAAGSHLPTATPQLPFAVAGPKFPDVSDWQGHPNWDAAKASIVGAAVKAYEYQIDPDFLWNVAQLKRLHIPWIAYDFVRSCNASGFIAALREAGGPQGPPIFDMEVPAAHNCAASLEAQVSAAFHMTGVIYSSPGLASSSVGNSDGLSIWVAAYGPSSPPCLFTCNVAVKGQQSILAWQFTDGRYGSRVFIPGIGTSDVSVDYGLFAAKPKPAPKPTPQPKPQPKPTQYNQGFLRGYHVGFNTAWKAAHHH